MSVLRSPEADPVLASADHAAAAALRELPEATILVFPMAVLVMFGHMVRNMRHAVVIGGVMMLFLVGMIAWVVYADSMAPNPALTAHAVVEGETDPLYRVGLPVDQIENNLQQIIDKVKARNPTVRVVIAGMQLPKYAADDYVSAFGKMFGDLASKNNAALVPYLLQDVAGDPSLNLPDGIHPNAAGQKILAENVWRVLEPIAREL